MIKEARKKQRLTQKELAIKCNLSQSFLSELESKNKKKNVTIKQIINISNKLKISPYELSDWLIDKELNKVEFSEELGVFKIG
jgi:transcriptional regulator with XRE-family HTH domain